jgi:S-formylglutathione hydrolase FrmB
MKSRFFIAMLIIATGAFLISGCTDKAKDNPTRPSVSQQGLAFLNSLSFYSLFFSTEMNPGYMTATALVPPGYDWQGGGGRPYPVLYMLSPFRGDDRYYFEHGLADVANRLWQEGKIQPMIIVSIDGRSPLGGSFFVNSAAQGRYFSALVENEDFLITHYFNPDAFPAAQFDITQLLKSHGMVNRFDDWYLTIPDRQARAICGVGMGGYGAFATVLKTGMFGSVSAVNAPLDFDGVDGNGGFKTLIQEVFPGSFTGFDTSTTNAAMSMVVSAGAAFSPFYTDFTIDTVRDDQFGAQTFTFTPTDSLGYTYDSSGVTVMDRSTLLPQHMIQLPIDSTGSMNSAAAQYIWNQWMKQDIASLYNADSAGQAANFRDMPKLLIESENADFHYTDQMNGFIAFLNQIGDTNHEVIDFKGNQLLTGTADHFLYDLLEDILIFHSEHFQIPGDIESR